MLVRQEPTVQVVLLAV